MDAGSNERSYDPDLIVATVFSRRDKSIYRSAKGHKQTIKAPPAPSSFWGKADVPVKKVCFAPSNREKIVSDQICCM